jgi:hypothetical protein
MSLTGLRAEHFEVYCEPKSRSNVYSRERLEIKEWLLGASAPLLSRLGQQGHSVEILASDHHPSLWNKKVVDRQWIFFSRGASDRASLERIVDHDRSLASTLMDPTPFFKSSFLSIDLSKDGFEASVRLHWRAWVDRDNFLARMRDDQQREAFVDTIAGLPDEYAFGVMGGVHHPVGEVDEQILMSVLHEFESTEGMLGVGLTVEPVKAVELGEDLLEVASVAFLLLAPAYAMLSWSEEQDWISLSDREQVIDKRRQAVSEKRRAEAEAFQSRKMERLREQQRRSEEEHSLKMDQQVFQERMRRVTVPAVVREDPRPVPVEVSPPRPSRSVQPEPDPSPPEQPPDATPADAEKSRKPASRRRQTTVRAVPFEVQKGARVEIASGVLAGKWGVVQEVVRDQAKVVLGSLVTRVPIDQLRPQGHGRR